MNKEICDYCIHHGPNKKVCGNKCIQYDDFEGVVYSVLDFELMAEIESLARTNEILTALAEKYRKERDELMDMVGIIPCQCDEAYKVRNLTDPDCPRCNWIYEDLIDRIKDEEQNQDKEKE